MADRWPATAIVIIIIIIVAACAAPPAVAAPPSPNSEDARIMSPQEAWITSRHDRQNNACCDIGDGRPAEANLVTVVDWDDVTRTHWRAHITPDHFPGESDRWVVIPDEKIVSGANPVGVPILWLYKGRVQCFAPPDMY